MYNKKTVHESSGQLFKAHSGKEQALGSFAPGQRVFLKKFGDCGLAACK